MFLTSTKFFALAIIVLVQIGSIFAKIEANQLIHDEILELELRITEEVFNQTHQQVYEKLEEHPNITKLIIHSVQRPLLFPKKVELRNLKNFVLIFDNNFDPKNSIYTAENLVESRTIEAGIPFTKNRERITLDNIVNTRVNIDVRVEGGSKPILKINHTTSEIISRYINISNQILSGGSVLGLKKLSVGYSGVNFNESLRIPLIPDTLEHLELDSVELTNGSLDGLLKKLNHLKNLFMDFPTGTAKFSLSSLSKSLQSLFIYNIAKMELGHGIELPNLQSLYIYQISTLGPKVIQYFDKIFPHLKYIVLWEHHLSLLPRLASISSLEEIKLTHYNKDILITALTTNLDLQKQFGPSIINCVRNSDDCYLKKVNREWVSEELTPADDLGSRFCQFDIDLCAKDD